VSSNENEFVMYANEHEDEEEAEHSGSGNHHNHHRFFENAGTSAVSGAGGTSGDHDINDLSAHHEDGIDLEGTINGRPAR
jgi:hypothetical protein